jgi:hypothetical protein
MSEPDDLKQKLLDKIKTRRAGVKAYASALEQRGVRLSNLGIICTTATAILTAGPALGGTKFTDSTGSLLGLSSNAIVWQVLCLLAVILSAVASLINNMNKPAESNSRLMKAQTFSILLERLEMELEFNQVSAETASKQFQETIAELSFIPEKAAKS